MIASKPKSSTEIAQRVMKIQSNWSRAERSKRHLEGQIRRAELLAKLEVATAVLVNVS